MSDLTIEQATETEERFWTALDEFTELELDANAMLEVAAEQGSILVAYLKANGSLDDWLTDNADRLAPLRGLPLDSRRKAEAAFVSAGLTQRITAKLFGIGAMTVNDDLRAERVRSAVHVPDKVTGADGKEYSRDKLYGRERPVRDHAAEDAAFDSYLLNSVAIRAGTDDPDEVLAYHLEEVTQQHQMDQAINEYRAGLQELMRKLREDTKHSGYGIREYGTNSLKPWREEAEEILEERSDTSAEDISELVEWGKYLSLFAEYLITRGESRLKELS